MKYIHGTDEKRHDRLMVWGNRVVFVVVLFVFLFFLGLFFLVVFRAFIGDAYGLRLLFFILPCLAVTLFGLHECLWSNSKYFLDEKGITLVCPLYNKQYPWSTFQKIYISPLRRGVRVSVAYDYIILMISECGALTRSLSIPECHKYQSHFLIIRKTKERVTEFCKYCTFSDRPNIKTYKFFD